MHRASSLFVVRIEIAVGRRGEEVHYLDSRERPPHVGRYAPNSGIHVAGACRGAHA